MEYHLIDTDNHTSVDITLPVLLNVGTQIEHATGTFKVMKIIKISDEVHLVCHLINETKWIMEFLAKQEFKVLKYALPVNA